MKAAPPHDRTGLAAASPVSWLWGRALDLVFPPRCAGCGALGSFICRGCRASMSKAEPPRCDVCWMPVLSVVEGPTVDVCARCRDSRPAFQAARAAFVYEGAARDAVHALKYDGLSALAGEMARSMAELLLQWNPAASAIVPVPLAGGRRRLRGYNQSELLAREISRHTGLPLARRALIRRRSTPPQARQPDEEARRRNVAGAFQRGRPVATGVLLVDDVMTTGATLDACARVLGDSGTTPVFALTFARED